VDHRSRIQAGHPPTVQLSQGFGEIAIARQRMFDSNAGHDTSIVCQHDI